MYLNIKIQTDLSECQIQEKQVEEKEEKCGFYNLHSLGQKMIHNSSSKLYQVTPDSLT